MSATAKETTFDLLRAEVHALLKGASAESCLYLRSQPTARTLRNLESLWNNKRAEILPDAPNTPLSNTKTGIGKRYSRLAWEAFLSWLTMPKGHYGTADEPRLDCAAAALYVGCPEPAILKHLRDRAIPDWSRDINRPLSTWKVADLDDFKSQNAGGLDVRAMAKRLGWSEMKVGNAFRRWRREKNGDDDKRRQTGAIKLEPHRRKFRQSYNGSLDYITEEEFVDFQASIQSQPKKPGYGSLTELQRAVGANKGATKREVGECAKVWHEIGMLGGEEAIVETTYKGKHASHQTRTAQTMTYNVTKFKELWSKILTANIGASLLMGLVPFDKKPVARLVQHQMKQQGFVGIRFHQAKRLAGIKDLLPEGGRVGRARLYVIPNPKKKLEIQPIAPSQEPAQEPRTPKTRTSSLTDRQSLILETMLKMEATSESAKQPQKAIVKQIHPNHDHNNYRRDFATLHKQGSTESIRGPDGGIWLTGKGISTAG